MDQFSAARLRAEKRLARAGRDTAEMGKPFLKPEIHQPILHLPKPPKQNGRHNEIDVTMFINGNEFSYSFKSDISGSLMSSQIKDEFLKRTITEMLSTKFGRTKML